MPTEAQEAQDTTNPSDSWWNVLVNAQAPAEPPATTERADFQHETNWYRELVRTQTAKPTEPTEEPAPLPMNENNWWKAFNAQEKANQQATTE